MASYFQEMSIGDVGGKDAKYVPKRGFPGTLAPGENFKENFAVDDLPKRILHPWPSMQEFQFHVRWPPAHPMIPPPVLFFGLNNMYTDNYTQWQLSIPKEETVGGLHMEPADAMRIARYHTIGRSYLPEEQIPHGGMVFKGGYDIPNYNPDHGPTVPPEEVDPPIPRELLPITERWLDPYFGLDVQTTKTDLPAELQVEADEEEEKRRVAAEKLIEVLQNNEAAAAEKERLRKVEEDIVARSAALTARRRKRKEEFEGEYGVDEEPEEVVAKREEEALATDLERARTESAREHAIAAVTAGKYVHTHR
jgi:hypothetical protein